MAVEVLASDTRRGIQGLEQRIMQQYEHNVRYHQGIQPHGVFVAFERESLRISHVSANAGRLAGAGGDAAALLGRPVQPLLVSSSWLHVERSFALSDAELRRAAPLRLQSIDLSWWNASVHRPRADLVALELEPSLEGDLGSLYAVMREIHHSTEFFAACRSEDELCRRASELLLEITGFDRCIVLDFDPDGNGRMRCEAVSAPEHARFADLRFPAADIPAVGRALFRQKGVRLIADVLAEQSPIVSADGPSARPLDLSDSVLRGPTPCCSEYHANVGIQGFCLWPVELPGEAPGEKVLWGLLNVHSCRPGGKFLQMEIRHSALLFVQAFQTALVRIRTEEAGADAARAKTVVTAMLASVREESGEREAPDFLHAALPRLAALVPADGACVVVGDVVHRAGRVPSERLLRALVARAGAAVSRTGRSCLHADSMGEFLQEGPAPPASLEPLEEDLAPWGGALLVRISPSLHDWLLWFRGAETLTVTWAGALAARSQPLGTVESLTPCSSFVRWEQTLRGRCKAWERGAVAAGESVGAALGEVLHLARELRSRREIGRLNSQLRHSYAELEAAAGEMRALVQHAPVPVFALDVEQRVTEWNPACEAVFGVPRPDILGRCFLAALVPAPYRPAVREAVERAMETRGTQEFEVAFKRAEGGGPPAGPLPPLALGGSGSPQPYFSVPAPAHLVAPGPPPPSPPLHPAAGPSPAPPPPAGAADRDGEREAPLLEVLVRAAARVDAAGGLLGAVLVCQDLTAQREVTRVQTRLAEAAAANSAKTFFLAALSHEMRTPLNGLLGMLQLAMDGGRDGGSSDLAECIAKAMSSGEYLAALIGNVLDLSLIEAGKLVLKAEPFSLHALVRSAIALLAPKAAEKGLAVALELAGDLPAGFVGDPDRLKQVLVNLVSNAIKYSARGEILVRVLPGGPPPPEAASPAPAPRPPPPRPGACSVRFEVSDQGVGVSADDQGRLFQLFVRIHSGTADPGGTGLGLAICKNLVEVMGGRIGVVSRVGAGSTFWFTVELEPNPDAPPAAAPPPAPEAPAGPAAPAAPPAAPERPARVFVVEDNPFNLEVCRKMLTRAGHVVEAAADGLQAVKAYRERLGLPPLAAEAGEAGPPPPAARRPSFDVVLMDCEMPVMDGLTASREMRRAEAELGALPGPGGAPRHVPIVALTAHALLETRAKCFEAGMDAYMTKPVNRAALLDIVARFASRRRASLPLGPEPLAAAGAGGRPAADLHSLRSLDGCPLPTMPSAARPAAAGGTTPTRLSPALSGRPGPLSPTTGRRPSSLQVASDSVFPVLADAAASLHKHAEGPAGPPPFALPPASDATPAISPHKRAAVEGPAAAGASTAAPEQNGKRARPLAQ